MAERLDPAMYRRIVREALAEDVGPGDITTSAIVPPTAKVAASIDAKAPCVLAGLDVAREVFAEIDPAVDFVPQFQDGDACPAGGRIVQLTGSAAGILTAERTALNFLQHLSGIATRTREFAAAAAPMKVLDTRKTIPGWRELAKYAVRCGGGFNHRGGLFDGVLIKDNHIRLAGGVAEAVRRVKAGGSALPIEVEAETLADVDAALEAGVEVIMLDNVDDPTTRAAIDRIAGRARVELSGGMTVERVRRLAGCGAEYVSIGALTHSAAAVDISLEIDHLIS